MTCVGLGEVKASGDDGNISKALRTKFARRRRALRSAIMDEAIMDEAWRSINSDYCIESTYSPPKSAVSTTTCAKDFLR